MAIPWTVSLDAQEAQLLLDSQLYDSFSNFSPTTPPDGWPEIEWENADTVIYFRPKNPADDVTRDLLASVSTVFAAVDWSEDSIDSIEETASTALDAVTEALPDIPEVGDIKDMALGAVKKVPSKPVAIVSALLYGAGMVVPGPMGRTLRSVALAGGAASVGGFAARKLDP